MSRTLKLTERDAVYAIEYLLNADDDFYNPENSEGNLLEEVRLKLEALKDFHTPLNVIEFIDLYLPSKSRTKLLTAIRAFRNRSDRDYHTIRIEDDTFKLWQKQKEIWIKNNPKGTADSFLLYLLNK